MESSLTPLRNGEPVGPLGSLTPLPSTPAKVPTTDTEKAEALVADWHIQNAGKNSSFLDRLFPKRAIVSALKGSDAALVTKLNNSAIKNQIQQLEKDPDHIAKIAKKKIYDLHKSESPSRQKLIALIECNTRIVKKEKEIQQAAPGTSSQLAKELRNLKDCREFLVAYKHHDPTKKDPRFDFDDTFRKIQSGQTENLDRLSMQTKALRSELRRDEAQHQPRHDGSDIALGAAGRSLLAEILTRWY